MALFDIEHPETGAIITVESESAPTQEEAERLIASIPSTPTTPEQRFVKQYIAAEQAPFLQQLASSAGRGLTGIKDIANTAIEGVQGFGQILGEASVPESEKTTAQGLQELILRSMLPGLSVIPGGASAARRAIPNLAQTGVESVGRMEVGLSDLVGEAVKTARERPQDLGNPITAYIQSLTSRTPTQEEAEAAFSAQQQAQGEAALANQPLVPEVLGEANVPLAIGAPILAALPQAVGPAAALTRQIVAPVGRAATRVASRGVFSAPLEDAITRTTGITAQEGAMDIIPIARTRILETVGAPPANALEAFRAATTTENRLIERTLNTLQTADEQGLAMSRDRVLQAAEASLRRAQPTITAEEVTAALEPFQRRLPERITPTQGQRILVEQNDALQNVFAETGVPARSTRGNAGVTTRLGIADSLSNQLDDIYKAVSGLDESPYRDWGQVREFKQGLSGEIVNSQRVQGGRAERGARGVPVTRAGLIRRAGNVVGRPFIPREIEAVDRGVQRIFREVPDLPPVQPIDPVMRQGLIDQYRPTPPPIPPTGAAAQAVSLEQAIQEAIRSLPREMRGRNERSIAEAIIRSQQAP